MSIEDRPLPFSQRQGLSPIPPQLTLGKVSSDFRRMVVYYITLEIESEENSGYDHNYFDGRWGRVTKDIFVLFLRRPISEYRNGSYGWKEFFESFVSNSKYEELFDLIEFLASHVGCSENLKRELASAFLTSKSAYRLINGQVIAIGNEQQAAAFEAALAATERVAADAARQHLLLAGKSVKDQNWAGSVRESIHAVEAVAMRLAPDAKTLGPALSVLEKEGHLHKGLKSAFSALYGYSSDEEGVRHALVFEAVAKVDEADALFMLGACASFVSYLIHKDGQS